MPELLHPRMADVYREKVSGLCEALEREDRRLGATNAIRGSIEAILLEPGRPTRRRSLVHLRAISCRCHRKMVSGITCLATADYAGAPV